MSDVATPRDHLLTWYDGLPSEIKHEIAFLSVPHVTSISEIGFDADKMIDSFRGWLGKPIEEKYLLIGHVLHARSVISFACRNRFTQEGWNEADVFHQKVEQDCRERGDERMANEAAEMRSKLPERATTWIPIGNTWEELLRTSLSDTTLNYWSLVESSKELEPKPVHIDLRRK